MNHSTAAYFALVMAFCGLCLALLWFAQQAAARELRQCVTDKRAELSAGCRAAAGG